MVHEKKPKRPWNTSTRLGERQAPRDDATRQPSHSRCTSPTCQSRRKGMTADPPKATQRPSEAPENPTRAMIERAFDAAFVSTLEDPELTGVSVERSVEKPSRGTLDSLQKADDAAKLWRVHYVRRRDQRQRATEEQRARDRDAAEFQRTMHVARIEYEQRKLAIQSLQARVQREMQFLEATATELSRREVLLDNAFEGYEEWMRRESGTAGDDVNARAG